MRDVRIVELAGRQFNRVSHQQLLALGLSLRAIERRVASGRYEAVEEGVYAIAPARDDDWAKWMGATLTAPGTVLSGVSAAAAWGFWGVERQFEIVTRPGNGGPRRHGGLLVHRSTTLEGECTELRGIPITTPTRTLLDLARSVGDRALARALREGVRLERTTLEDVGEGLGRHRGRRGTRRLAEAVARYSGLPLERVRSGAEIRALQILRSAGRPLPALNVRVAGEEADLVWSRQRLIIEVDGGPFHLDAGEDARKETAWRAARWTVRRIPADDVYEQPHRLIHLAPTQDASQR
jgi:hypothetical protein